MENIFERIKWELKKEANLYILNSEEIAIRFEKGKEYIHRKAVDNRFENLKNIIDTVENKDDVFYAKLVQTISLCIDELYGREIDYLNVSIVNENQEGITSTNFGYHYDIEDKIVLEQANRDLTNQLFNYVCEILTSHKDIVLDSDILRRLLNRNPKLFSLSRKEKFTYRTLDFGKLSKILKENQTFQKSNMNLDEIYQILIDTYQINNEEVVRTIIEPSQFKENHKKMDGLLMRCNAKGFVEITNIIINCFDENFDRLKFIKKRTENNFCEKFIIGLLNTRCNKNDVDLIHQILTDKEINTNYDIEYLDWGNTLKSVIALSGIRTLIKDLLSKKENVQNSYRLEFEWIYLYELYAIVGDYDKMIETFQKTYSPINDYSDNGNEKFNIVGYSYYSFKYKDSLVNLINDAVKSFELDNTEYSRIKEVINQILTNPRVQFIVLEETLLPLKDVLTIDDFQELLNSLIDKYNGGSIKFIKAIKNDFNSYIETYTIKIASDEEVQESIATLKNEDQKSLEINKKK